MHYYIYFYFNNILGIQVDKIPNDLKIMIQVPKFTSVHWNYNSCHGGKHTSSILVFEQAGSCGFFPCGLGTIGSWRSSVSAIALGVFDIIKSVRKLFPITIYQASAHFTATTISSCVNNLDYLLVTRYVFTNGSIVIPYTALRF